MSRWQSVYEERPTFERLLGGKGYSLAGSHRKRLALAKDYRLQDTMGASDEELLKIGFDYPRGQVGLVIGLPAADKLEDSPYPLVIRTILES